MGYLLVGKAPIFNYPLARHVSRRSFIANQVNVCVAVLLAAGLFACGGGGGEVGGGTTPGNSTPPPATGAQPYQWYPALDLNTVEFHRAAGAWGPQKQVQTPAAPNTNRVVNVSTAAELITAARVPGTQIIVTSSITKNIAIAGNIVDIDLVIPPGITIGTLSLGQYNSANVVNRVRIRGPTVGSYSGGCGHRTGVLCSLGRYHH